MPKFRPLPSADEVRRILSYDKQTGDFHWKVDRCGWVKAGDPAGSLRKQGYVYISIRGYGALAAHRLAWLHCFGVCPDGEIDHRDGDPSNNAIWNLRAATSSEQKQNKRVQSNNRAGLKGAYFHACHKPQWRSQIRVDGKHIFLGYFNTPEEAHEAYGEAAKKYYGEFARTA